jgi:hypothetical protein
MSKIDKLYETIMHDAVEHVYIYALRHSMDSRVLAVEFDAGRGPGPHSEHTLTISLRASPISVVASDIPHDWLSAGTGYIDTRLSKTVGTLLSELQKKAKQAGLLI